MLHELHKNGTNIHPFGWRGKFFVKIPVIGAVAKKIIKRNKILQ